MRDTLPARPLHTESAIINLDSSKQKGTHWVAYFKKGHIIEYFDPIGNLPPPRELYSYIKNKGKIYYNTQRYQNLKANDCGYHCFLFIKNKS